jgi:NAD(P)-dependent dehydrogenase (short-subunit alcohol dehydrogenase family)
MFTDGLRTHSAALAQCTPLLIATPGRKVVIVSTEAKQHRYGAAYAMAKAADDRLALAVAVRNCGSTGSPRSGYTPAGCPPRALCNTPTAWT